MRTALVLAYQFPPIGGAGVLRAIQLARLLPDFGYRPVVVTGPGHPGFAWTPEDTLLVDRIRGTAAIERIQTSEPPAPGRLRRIVERTLDRWSAIDEWWVTGAEQVGRRVGATADVILCELGPYETAEAAAQLSHDLGIPWVADLQDPWALDEMWVYPSDLHRRRDLGRMRRLLGSAGGIVLNTAEALARLERAFPELAGATTTAIPNGFDPDDFRAPAPPRDDGRFRIVHTGTFHTTLALSHRASARRRRLLGGMAVPGVDFLTRSHVYLLQALDRLVADDPGLSAVMELHLAGALTPEDRWYCDRSRATVVEHSFLSHSESVSLVRSADLLFLPMQRLPAGTRAGLVPAKTYEYLASGAPVLAAVPEGDARDLLEEAGSAILVEPDDVAAMAAAVRASLDLRAAGERPAAPRPEVVARYEWPSLVGRIARQLDLAVGD